jgi:hypothetical protein
MALTYACYSYSHHFLMTDVMLLVFEANFSGVGVGVGVDFFSF